MDLATDLAAGLLSGFAYAALGIVLLMLGYKVIDWVTPGDLSALLYSERNQNAAILVSSGLLALSAVITTAVVTSHDNFVEGIASAAGYGFLGIVLLGASFKVVDALTPGDLGLICTDAESHPAVWVTAVAHLAMGAVLAAAIS